DWARIPPALLAAMMPSAVTPGFMDGVRLGAAGLRGLDLGRVTASALLAWGRKDRIIPLRYARRLAAGLPSAQLGVFGGVGHCAAAGGFLDGCRGAAARRHAGLGAPARRTPMGHPGRPALRRAGCRTGRADRAADVDDRRALRPRPPPAPGEPAGSRHDAAVA